MAMQSGIGFSKIIILVGAGYTSTILLKNGKLSDILGELQSLVKGYDNKQGDSSDGDHSDAIAAQVRRLAMEVRQLASARQITVLNGNASQIGNITSLIVPAAALGAIGYGYMWWKGFSFSDLMYVTKRNMASAVSNLTKHLEHVSEALAATKRHLTQRIENLDGKLDDQLETSKLIRKEVNNVQADLTQIGYDLGSLQRMVYGLDGKIMSLEEKQDLANFGVWYLCSKADGKKIPGNMQEQFKQLIGKSFGNPTDGGILSLEGVKEIADTLQPGDVNRSISSGNAEDGSYRVDPPRTLTRNFSTKHC